MKKLLMIFALLNVTSFIFCMKGNKQADYELDIAIAAKRLDALIKRCEGCKNSSDQAKKKRRGSYKRISTLFSTRQNDSKKSNIKMVDRLEFVSQKQMADILSKKLKYRVLSLEEIKQMISNYVLNGTVTYDEAKKMIAYAREKARNNQLLGCYQYEGPLKDIQGKFIELESMSGKILTVSKDSCVIIGEIGYIVQ